VQAKNSGGRERDLEGRKRRGGSDLGKKEAKSIN